MTVSHKPLTLASLVDLDMGKATLAFQQHLARAAADCIDRPGDTKPRKVILEISMVPVIENDGSCDEVNSQICVSSKVPRHQTKVYSFGVRKNGSLVFNPDSPDNVSQGTFTMEDEGDDDA